MYAFLCIPRLKSSRGYIVRGGPCLETSPIWGNMSQTFSIGRRILGVIVPPQWGMHFMHPGTICISGLFLKNGILFRDTPSPEEHVSKTY